MSESLGTVADLFIYPIKSLGGVRVERATVTDLGLDGDRRWMLVDDDGTFVTQRAVARMARLHATPLEGGVRVTTDGLPVLELAPPTDNAPQRRVEVWDDVVDAATYPTSVDAWFSAALERSVHLVYMRDDTRRIVDQTYARPDDRAAFSDGFPILVASHDSLADLNARLAARDVAPVVIQRFRPNVVVSGTRGAFVEDTWSDIALGDAALRIVKPCARCVLTTVDPSTGVPSPRGEPLRTLATYRTHNGKTLFAQNALVIRPGTIRVGDAVNA